MATLWLSHCGTTEAKVTTMNHYWPTVNPRGGQYEPYGQIWRPEDYRGTPVVSRGWSNKL